MCGPEYCALPLWVFVVVVVVVVVVVTLCRSSCRSDFGWSGREDCMQRCGGPGERIQLARDLLCRLSLVAQGNSTGRCIGV